MSKSQKRSILPAHLQKKSNKRLRSTLKSLFLSKPTESRNQVKGKS